MPLLGFTLCRGFPGAVNNPAATLTAIEKRLAALNNPAYPTAMDLHNPFFLFRKVK
jgi:hypothetical protein